MNRFAVVQRLLDKDALCSICRYHEVPLRRADVRNSLRIRCRLLCSIEPARPATFRQPDVAVGEAFGVLSSEAHHACSSSARCPPGAGSQTFLKNNQTE